MRSSMRRAEGADHAHCRDNSVIIRPASGTLLEKHRPDLFVCGHSYILKVQRDEKSGHLHLNPGAAGVNGFQ